MYDFSVFSGIKERRSVSQAMNVLMVQIMVKKIEKELVEEE